MRSLLFTLIALVIVYPQSSFGQNIPPKGFKALFNGKDLKGWFGHGTKDPRTLWKMSPDELKAHHENCLLYTSDAADE